MQDTKFLVTAKQVFREYRGILWKLEGQKTIGEWSKAGMDSNHKILN